MGNGESTARRISMQRSDEGIVKISEDLMQHLVSKERVKPVIQPDITLKPGEAIFQQDDVKKMMQQAFDEGVKRAKLLQQKELEQARAIDLEKIKELEHEFAAARTSWDNKIQEADDAWRNQLIEKDLKLEQLEAALKAEIEKYNLQSSELGEVKVMLDSLRSLPEKIKDYDDKVLALQSELAAAAAQQLEKVESREKVLKDKYDQGVRHVEEMLTPLKRSPVCEEVQSRVLQCYRDNRTQPLRCSQEVRAFVACVQAARLKLLQGRLDAKEAGA